ncbi:hypothetical protein RRG08_040299 [Elysia crispata]|uniref:Uncharacterized protein n=1 Tax=Elysia crispata TaxID=231223 RepID=A0AAE0Z2D2_9GAST|nr:hypothetical protein RRG08_040299 [Elysia crispata]
MERGLEGWGSVKQSGRPIGLALCDRLTLNARPRFSQTERSRLTPQTIYVLRTAASDPRSPQSGRTLSLGTKVLKQTKNSISVDTRGKRKEWCFPRRSPSSNPFIDWTSSTNLICPVENLLGSKEFLSRHHQHLAGTEGGLPSPNSVPFG